MNAVRTTVEREKKRKNAQAAQAHYASFLLSVDGLMVCETCFVVHFIGGLSTKWIKSYDEVMSELDCHLLSSDQQT